MSIHPHNAWHAALGVAALVNAIRDAPIEPGMPVAPIMVIAPPPITVPQGDIAPKFAGGAEKCAGLAKAYIEVCEQPDCHFFDAGTVISASGKDGVHLDADAHERLGRALAEAVGAILKPQRK